LYISFALRVLNTETYALLLTQRLWKLFALSNGFKN
jgi:hypothetical protein